MSARRPSPACEAPTDAASAVQKGRAAESLVSKFLTDRGYVMLAHNLRVGRDELDLVALDGPVLVVVEVRARRANALVHPLLTLKPDKLDRLRRATTRLMIDRGDREARIDVASVIDGAIDYIENAVDFSGR